MTAKPIIAIAAGDPAGIGPEIALKAALDGAVRDACNPIVVSDPALLAQHGAVCGISTKLRVAAQVGEANWSDRCVNVLACPQPEAAGIAFGTHSAASGRAALAFAEAAIKAAMRGEVSAVVAAPQNETSIALAGIVFDGYPSFVAHATGTARNDVFLMLCYDDVRIAHCTLHCSVKEALAMITPERVLRVIRTTERTLLDIGIRAPKIAVGGLNPHAGEDGLFGREEIEIIRPAISQARTQGIAADGPFGADTMLQSKGFDAFVVMLHDQGHVAAKLMAPNRSSAWSIGTPILFSSVAHGSGHDIAGKGRASPAAMIEALLQLARIKQRPKLQRAH